MKFFEFSRGSVLFKRLGNFKKFKSFGAFKPLVGLKNTRGDGYIPACIITVCVCMVLSVTISFISAVTAVNQSKRDVRQALDGFVTHKSIEIYNGVKNYSEFAETLDEESFESILSEYTGAQGNYEIKDLKIEFRETERLNYTVSYTLKAPVRFGNITAVYTNVPVKITGVFNFKFRED